MKKLIIFDLDGTLVNAYPAVVSSVNYTLGQLGFRARSHAAIKKAVGWGDKELVAQFVGEKLAGRAIRLYRPHHDRALSTPGMVKFLPGAKALIKSLHAEGYKLAIATNRPRRFTTLILKNLGMQEYFDMVLCADQAPRPKPYPDMLNIIIKRFKVKKTEALYAGDMTIDVQTGKRAGVRTVAVTTGSSSLVELKTLKPWLIINRIGQIKTAIKAA